MPVQFYPGVGSIIPAGVVVMWATDNNPPTGWLFCRGQAVSRTTYAALWAAIGATFGAGDGVTTFNVPDYRGKSPYGSGAGQGVGDNAGSSTHTHTATLSVSSASDSGTNGDNNLGSYSVSNQTGTATGTTDAGSSLHPVLCLNFIIKA